MNQGSLNHLETTINRLNLPGEQIPQHLNAREATVHYLRRLQSEMLRFIPQLNRGIQLTQEGRFTHLNDLIPVFHSLNFANTAAIELIQRYVVFAQQHQHHHHHHHQQPNNEPNTINNPMNTQNQQQGMQQRPNNQGNQNPQIQPNPVSNPFNMLSGLMGPNSGFNFANLFSPPQQGPQQQQQGPQQQQGSQQQPQP